MTLSFTCPYCGRVFERERRIAFRSARDYCSIRCGALARGRSDPEKFWAHTSVQLNGCRHWNGVPETGGYGVVKIAGRPVKAHRRAWELARGPIPEGMSVLHRCDNRICVEPTHLFLGDAADNMRDMVAKGRGVSRRGERNPMVKLSDEQVRTIRARCVRHGRYGNSRRLAEEFGVSLGTVQNIVVGKERREAGGLIVAVRMKAGITKAEAHE